MCQGNKCQGTCRRPGRKRPASCTIGSITSLTIENEPAPSSDSIEHPSTAPISLSASIEITIERDTMPALERCA